MQQESEVYPETEVATSNYRRPEIDTTTLPVKSGTYKEVSICFYDILTPESFFCNEFLHFFLKIFKTYIPL